MEEVYVIKLKGLPINDSSEVSKKPSIYANDLSVEVLYGFGLFHLVIGLISILFGLITVASDEWKVTTVGIACGTIFVSTGFIGIWSSIQRRDHFLTSNIAVRIFLILSTISLITSLVTILLMVIGSLDIDTDQLIKTKTNSNQLERRTITDYDGELIFGNRINNNNLSEVSNVNENTIDIVEVHPHIKTNLLISLVVEVILSLLTMFTTCRILWPESLKSFGGVNWPTRPEVRKKIIVKTSIHASSKGLYQAADFCRALGPNCVVSLSPPKTMSPSHDQPLNYQQSHEVPSSNHGIVQKKNQVNHDHHQIVVKQLNKRGSLTDCTLDSVSLASYEGTEFGHDDDEQDLNNHEHDFVSRTNSSTSHLLPSLNHNHQNEPDLSIHVSEEKNQQQVKLKPSQASSVKQQQLNNSRRKKRIPAPKQPPPPPPPPSSLPPPLVIKQQQLTLTSKTTEELSPSGHCVQKEVGGDNKDGSVSKEIKRQDDEKEESKKMMDTKDDGAKEEKKIKSDKTKFIDFMNGSTKLTNPVKKGQQQLTVAEQLSFHLNRLKLKQDLKGDN